MATLPVFCPVWLSTKATRTACTLSVGAEVTLVLSNDLTVQPAIAAEAIASTRTLNIVKAHVMCILNCPSRELPALIFTSGAPSSMRLDQRPRLGALPARRPAGDHAGFTAQRRRQDPQARDAPALLEGARRRCLIVRANTAIPLRSGSFGGGWRQKSAVLFRCGPSTCSRPRPGARDRGWGTNDKERLKRTPAYIKSLSRG